MSEHPLGHTMAPTSILPTCAPETFASCTFIPGAQVLQVFATQQDNPSSDTALPSIPFCNVTVVYTHGEEDADQVTVEAWMPLHHDWNQRFEAVGGGGWVAGRSADYLAAMAPIVSEGYVSATTDAGLGTAESPVDWPPAKDGGINWPLVENFAHRAYNDEVVLAQTRVADPQANTSLCSKSILVKQLIASYYTQPLLYSYWYGCSQGGRQGMSLAQRHPEAFDGIVAHAPAIFLPELVNTLYGPQQFMNDIGDHPHACEIDGITRATIEICDGLDGIKDSEVANISVCRERIDPNQFIGKRVPCPSANKPYATREISAAAAAVTRETWKGSKVVSNASRVFDYGYNPSSDITGNLPSSLMLPGAANTTCDENGVCVGDPNFLVVPFYKYFIKHDPNYNLTTMTREEFEEYGAWGEENLRVLQTADPDLTEFRNAGGKMVTFHGLADQIIPPAGTQAYYEGVQNVLPDVRDFFRYFPTPGVAHCGAGTGAWPRGLRNQVHAWVEQGIAPDSSPVNFTDINTGVSYNRVVCAVPLAAEYNEACGDVTAERCWNCV